MLRCRARLSAQDMMNELEISAATLKRDLEFLRNRLNAPILYDRAENTYRLGKPLVGERHELPGLWFDENELYALLTAHQLLSGLDPDGALSRHVRPLLDRIHQLLGQSEADKLDTLQRIRVAGAAHRPVQASVFEAVCAALLERKRLHFGYLTRSRKSVSQREVSPQRLIHYRGTWYLDGHCHDSKELRRFALDAMSDTRPGNQVARDVAIKTVEKTLDGGYGIYAGNAVRWATLMFNDMAAQWVSREQWHPEQRLRALNDGRLEMQLPFVNITELCMDVLRHGPAVEVIDPPDLREAVGKQLRLALALYAGPDAG